jgi:hypothetical protein
MRLALLRSQAENRGGKYNGVAWYMEFHCRYLGLCKPSKDAAGDPQEPALQDLDRYWLHAP